MRFNKTPKEIDVAFLSRKLTPDEICHFNDLLPAYNLLNTRLEIKQDSHDLNGEILQEINGQNRVLTEKEREVELLKAQLGEYRIDALGLRREVSILFPELTDVSIGKHRVEPDSGMGETKTVFLYRYTGKQPFTESERLKKWLAEKLRSPHVEVVEKR